MKAQRHALLSILLGLIILYGYLYKFIVSRPLNISNDIGDFIYNGIVIPLLILMLFSFIVRKKSWTEPFFTSRFNILNEKVKYSKRYNIPKELLIDKIKEVIELSEFTLSEMGNDRSKLFAFTKLSWSSFGENLYISFEEEKEGTKINICGTTVIGYTSWGRNKKNINSLIDQIEESLII